MAYHIDLSNNYCTDTGQTKSKLFLFIEISARQSSWGEGGVLAT